MSKYLQDMAQHSRPETVVFLPNIEQPKNFLEFTFPGKSKMNRTTKEATVKRYRYDNHEQFEAHLIEFINS